MPIYAYRCESCGFSKDVLQKMSDAPLTDCPQCGTASFRKQVTAAGFQLKGSGWYVTDFRNGSGGTTAAATSPSDTGHTATSGTAESSASKPAESSAKSETSSAPAVSAPAAGTTPSTGTS
jgi:putative FmdB family regulatory protein